MTQHFYGGEKVWWKIWQSIPLYLKLPMIIFCQFWADPHPPLFFYMVPPSPITLGMFPFPYCLPCKERVFSLLLMNREFSTNLVSMNSLYVLSIQSVGVLTDVRSNRTSDVF